MSSSSDETPPNDLPNENQPVEQSTDPSIDLPADPPVQIPPAELPPHNQFVLPESLLKLETVEQALNAMLSATLWPILVHTPIGTDGGCSCGKKHEKSANGSSSAGKHPIAKNWQTKIASRDELFDQLARLKFTPNVGVVLGKQPSGHYILAVDVDDLPRFTVIEAEHGPLPKTVRCDSGRGYRLFYEAPQGIDTSTFVNVTGLGGEPGVDVKVKAGQVVVAPSLHANGKRYVWTEVGPVATLPMAWALELVSAPEVPTWIQKHNPSTLYKDGRARSRAEKYLEAVITGNARAIAACGEGMRNSTLFKLACRTFEHCAGLQLSRSWDHVHSELLSAARASGLSEKEARHTIDSADKRIRESGKVHIPVVLQAPDTRPQHHNLLPAPAGSPEVGEVSTGSDWRPPDENVSSDGRPIIKVTTELYINVSEAISALRVDQDLFQREKKLVSVPRVTQEESDASVVVTDEGEVLRPVIEGTPQISELEIPTIRERLSRVAVFQKWNEKQHRYMPVMPTDEIVSAVRKRKDWPGIRSIIGVVETPTFRPDGEIVQNSGYDPITRYLYLPSEKFPVVTDEMATQDYAIGCFQFMSEIFEDFPYVNASHRAVPIAAILTLIARPAILGSVPAFLFDASTRGSGKTLQTDAIATVTTGRGAPRMNYTADEVEMEKILGGYALNGASFICLDNVPTMRMFGGGPLDRVLTARDMVDLRVLGSTKVLTLPWRTVLMATGNNMNLFGDTARRVMKSRLEPVDESPERRTKFKHPDLLAWVRMQRPRLVAAGLLILRAYWRAGCPNMGCARWGSFEEWSKIIPNAIVFAGGADPMLARPEKDEEVDTDTRAATCFLTKVRDLVDEEPFRVNDIVNLLYKSERKRNEKGDVVDDGFDDLRDAIETLVGRKGRGRDSVPDAVELGRKIGSFRGRIIDGLRLTSKTGHGGTLRWQIVKPT
jgi:hypothetical protein